MSRQQIGRVVMPLAYLVAGIVLIIGLTLIASKALAFEVWSRI